jgi:aspartate 1-decarboxylase
MSAWLGKAALVPGVVPGVVLAVALGVALGGACGASAQGVTTDAKSLPPFSPVVAFVEVATGKIHAATVTQANLNFIGSVTIDRDLMDAAGFYPHMMVQITNNANGAFWETYIIEGPRGSGVIALNGAPARHFEPGDKVFIVSHAMVEPGKLADHWMRTVFVDDKNHVTELRKQAYAGDETVK